MSNCQQVRWTKTAHEESTTISLNFVPPYRLEDRQYRYPLVQQGRKKYLDGEESPLSVLGILFEEAGEHLQVPRSEILGVKLA